MSRPAVLADELLSAAARQHGARTALIDRHGQATFTELDREVDRLLLPLRAAGIAPGQRAALRADKDIATVAAFLALWRLGAIVVPLNPGLKPEQVAHILRDCQARQLPPASQWASGQSPLQAAPGATSVAMEPADRHDMQPAVILYTSGSTGLPKGVVLSHHNLIAGARSVTSYLGQNENDRILAALPLSFDAGLSQITTGLISGATVILHHYLLPQDCLRLMALHRVTGLTGVPPLWIQLSRLDWPQEAAASLRYFANTGGRMPLPVLQALRGKSPQALPFLMYGLTEAFRSTYLDPAQVGLRPESIGKAIPEAQVLVLRPDGSICDDEEPGELVHVGPTVTLGYWNDPERTAQRFRPLPRPLPGLPWPALAVWSGDTVRRDREGFLYFVGRRDEMIKTSGYRVSPTEIEEAAYRSGLLTECVAYGIEDFELGQAIALIGHAPEGPSRPAMIESLKAHLKSELPPYMQPRTIQLSPTALPRNDNGKLDRPRIIAQARSHP